MSVDDEQQQTKMETDEQLSGEKTVKDKSEDDKSQEEEVESAPVIKHLEENRLFSEYYLGQGILTADEVEQFCEFVKKPVPWTFRISNIGSNVSEIHTILKSDFLSKNSAALSSLPWYPNELAWKMNVQQEAEATMEALNQFIAHETACGNVEQQDATGLIPALLLNVERHHKVLDMRAIKSLQLMDLVHRGCTVLDKKTDGVVIAGEPYFKRCCDLAEFMPNLFSPHFAIVNLDPASLHGLYIDNKENNDHQAVKYDRILCDLVSSNDGMCRSNREGLQNWSPIISHDHHGRMCRVLHSGTCQLAVGGRLVFYTYSMNPVENEAVVAALLAQQKGSVELVDVSTELSNIQYKNGLSKWKVMVRAGRWFDDFNELRNTLRYRVNESVFPPSTEKAEKFHLERCVRIMPHQQDTAGMFIAVIRRTRALEDVLKEEREAWAKAQQEKAEAAKKRAEEAKAAAEKAAAERAAAAAAAAAEQEAAKKAEDEGGQKTDETKPSGGEDGSKSEETAMDTGSGTEKSADGGKRDDSSKVKEEPKKPSSESKDDTGGKEQTHRAASSDGSKTESSHETEEKDKTKMCEDRSTVAQEAQRRDHDSASWDSRQTHDDELPAKRPRRDMPVGDVFISLGQDDPIWTSIRDFFGMSSDFPLNQLMTRGDEKTSLFYVSPTLRQLIECNQSTVNFVHAGVRAFCRMSDADSACKYRITQDGLPAIYPFLSRRIVQLTKEEFVDLLKSQPVPINSFNRNTKQALSKLEKGNVVFICRPNPRKADSGQLMVTGWSDGLHCRTFLAHYKRLHCLRACGVTVEDPDKNALEISATEALTAFAHAASAMECY